jgi:hypothetical protein
MVYVSLPLFLQLNRNIHSAKINAYANIQADIDRHLSDLGERDELLDAARKKLITQSGNALG